VISSEQLNHEIDLSTVDFDFLTQHKRETTSGKLTGDVPLQPAKESGTGSARDPELVALEDVIAQINDLFSGDHPDSSVRNVVTHIKDRLEESETLQQQAHNNTLAQFSGQPGSAERVRRRGDRGYGFVGGLIHPDSQQPGPVAEAVRRVSADYLQRVEGGGVGVRRHDLRHTFAVQQLSAVVHFVQVSKWLGHSTFTLTLDVYGDYIPEEDGGAANNLPEPPAPAKRAEQPSNVVNLFGRQSC
jgi:hypothetical protein